MPRLDIVAEDGNLRRRVLTITETGNSIILAFVKEGEDHHYVYHADGNTFETIGSKEPIPLPKGLPFDQFKGFYPFPGWGISKNLVEQKEPEIIASETSKKVRLNIAGILSKGLNPSFLTLLIEPGREDIYDKILNTISSPQDKMPPISYLLRETKLWVLSAILGTRSISAPTIVFINGQVKLIQISDKPYL